MCLESADKDPSEVPAGHTTANLTFENFSGVAYASGNSITIRTQHVQNAASRGQDVVREILGVMHHEITRLYRNNHSDANPPAPQRGGIIEGVADFTRYMEVYKTYGNRRKGGTWGGGYDTTSFVIEYLDRTYFEFGCCFNQSLSSRDGRVWDASVLQQLTGKSVDTLWAEYQTSF